MARKYPEGFFSANELARIKWDKAAYWIRWGAAGNTANETMRFDDTDRAIKETTQNIAFANAKKLDKNWDKNARFDLIIALRDRVYMQEAVTEGEKLVAENIKLSPEVMIALGDAYLYLEEPELAKQWYFSALKESPKSFPLRLSIFYAHLEAEDHNDAFKAVEKLVSEQALREVVVYKGSDGAKPTVVTDENPNKTESEATFSMASAYLDDLDAAEEKTKFLSDSAPHNQYLRSNLATVYYLRGWPRRAQEEYEIGLNADPKNVDLRIDLARNLLELKEYRQSEKQVTDMYNLYPEHKHAQKQYKLWEIHNDRELHVEVNGSETSGAQQQGSRDFGIDSHLYTSPIDYNFRIFLHNRWTKAKFLEGLGQTRHEGVGVEYTRPNFKLTTEIHNTNYATSTNKIGFSVGGNYAFDDQWSINSLFESVSMETPWRALKNNVYAQSINIGGKFRQHESREISVNGAYLNFSDGNQNYVANSAYMERWYSGSVYKFATTTNLFYTQNSKQDVPYYSPKRNFVSSVTFDNDWLSYRHYDTSWNQNLAFTVGQTWQESFGNRFIYAVQYQHRWQAFNRLELIYGTGYGRQYYDGDKAFIWQYSLLLNWRF
jgi:biofilm PGA synthesis protein PgaA